MITHLAQHHPDVRKAVLRGAIASAYMNDNPAADSAVWVPGTQTVDGRLPGIAQTTLSALREIGLLNEIGESDDGVITYPNETISEPTYQSVGIKNAWFGIYQQEAKDAGLPVPERVQDLDPETRKAARKQFKQTAKSLSGTDITIKEEKNETTGQTQLIAYADKVRLGEVSDQEKVSDGQKVTIQCSFARSSNLRIAYSDEVTAYLEVDSNETDSD